MTSAGETQQSPVGLPLVRGEPLEVAPGIWMVPGFGNATLLLTDDGAAVFSVGSITYVSSLLVDRHISTITSNVLRRFLQ